MLWTIISIFCFYLLRVNCFNLLIQLLAVKVNKRCVKYGALTNTLELELVELCATDD